MMMGSYKEQCYVKGERALWLTEEVVMHNKRAAMIPCSSHAFYCKSSMHICVEPYDQAYALQWSAHMF